VGGEVAERRRVGNSEDIEDDGPLPFRQASGDVQEMLHLIDQDEDMDEEEAKEEAKGLARLSGKLNSIVRWVSDSLGGGTLEKQLEENLRKSTMFKYLSDASLKQLMKSMNMENFKKGDVLSVQGAPQTSSIVVVAGSVTRLRVIDDQLHHMNTLGDRGSTATIGALHLMREDPSFATVRAASDGVCYRLQSDTFRELLDEQPGFAQEVIYGLTKEIRNHSHTRTPLFLQSGKSMPAEPLPWFAVSCAAAIESFYRSGLNAFLNAQLSGTARGSLFPNMHIQLPTRIVYINGFKGLRHVLDKNVAVSDYDNPQLVGLGLAVLPGLVMTPVSSILEACNASANPEPLSIRWTRGIIPRCAREVIFGIGINQLSDFCEERMEIVQNQSLRNLGGSMVAGILAGYLSHVPHNLSTLKLLNPKLSYGQHFQSMSTHWANWFDKSLYPNSPNLTPRAQAFRAVTRKVVVPTLSCVLPKGSMIRTAQIAGSFLIINAAVNSLSHINVKVSVSRAQS